MAVEEVRARLRRKLVGMVGMKEADLLLGPPGGWDEVVTRELLHLEIAVIETRMIALEQRMDRVEARLDGIEREIRAQTWKLVAAMTGLLGALTVAIKL